VRLVVSFSGGETSGFMAQWLLRNAEAAYGATDLKFIFANTGQENEATLEFVDRCDRYFGLGVVWVEADVVHGAREAPKGRVVDFASASRQGEPFEQAVKKYGLPNHKFKHCTRSLKLAPITDYLKQCGWPPKTYHTAVGIRSDEIDRVSAHAESNRIIYPLVSKMKMTKPKINFWWSQQPFRLQLKGYQGNCSWCWKKSDRKHYTLIRENPEIYTFPSYLEMMYGNVGPEFRAGIAEYRERVMFRQSRDAQTLLQEAEALPDGFTPAEDDAAVFDPKLDVGAGCEESCEVYDDDPVDLDGVFG
jgi:hypothetical protein